MGDTRFNCGSQSPSCLLLTPIIYPVILQRMMCLCVCVCAQSLQSCLTLCISMDCSPPGSSILGILQIRILEWVAMPCSRGSSRHEGSNFHLLCLLHWWMDSLPLGSPGKAQCMIGMQFSAGKLLISFGLNSRSSLTTWVWDLCFLLNEIKIIIVPNSKSCDA